MSKNETDAIIDLAISIDNGPNKFELHKQAVALGWKGDYARARKMNFAVYIAQKHFERPAKQPVEQVRNNRSELVAAAHAAASAAVAILSLLSQEQ